MCATACSHSVVFTSLLCVDLVLVGADLYMCVRVTAVCCVLLVTGLRYHVVVVCRVLLVTITLCAHVAAARVFVVFCLQLLYVHVAAVCCVLVAT